MSIVYGAMVNVSWNGALHRFSECRPSILQTAHSKANTGVVFFRVVESTTDY